MMTTSRGLSFNKCYTHTWMVYIPGLPLDLDYPEVLGLRVPLATLVQNNLEDQLFTVAENAPRGRDPGRGLRQGGCRRAVSVYIFSGPAQVRPPHAGGGVRLV